jgi:hypothetical protein
MRRELLGGLAAAALIGSGLAMSPAASMPMAGKAATSVKCKPGAGGAANARVPHGVKPTRDPNTLTPAQAAAMEARTARLVKNYGINPSARPAGSVRVPTHVHVLTRNDGSGDVSNRRIHRQMWALNKGFSGRSDEEAADTPFRFRLMSIDRTRNTDWYDMDSEDSREARRALRVGNAKHLNFYVTNFDGDLDGLLGFATFPESYKKYPRLDGAVLWRQSLPGGNAIYQDDEDGDEPDGTFNYAKGDTATHEVGHWMNLYHTFQGSCSKRNDFVADTPRQKADVNVFYCRPGYNTCGEAATPKDPVRNFMSYGDDRCLNRFTPGQRDRMNISWYIRQHLSN